MVVERDYDVLCLLGEGTFGRVDKARHRQSGEIVAIKQIKLGSKSWDEACKSMELQALKALRHQYIVRLRELIRSPADGSLYYVFEFIDSDLMKVLRNFPNGMQEMRATTFARQLFEGMAHMHQHSFFHRDLKPENILYDSATDTIRIADLGQARNLRSRPPFTDYVGTRWYRAPECLLRDTTYSSPVDIWACGLIFAELLRGSAVFRGTSSVDQLYQIIVVFGVPADWPEYKRLVQNIRFRGPSGGACGLRRILPHASGPVMALLGEVLSVNPRQRPVAHRCVRHALFASLAPEGPKGAAIPERSATPSEGPPPDAADNEPHPSTAMGSLADGGGRCGTAAGQGPVGGRCGTAAGQAPQAAVPTSADGEQHGGPPRAPGRTGTAATSASAAAAPPARNESVMADTLDLDAALESILGGDDMDIDSPRPDRGDGRDPNTSVLSQVDKPPLPTAARDPPRKDSFAFLPTDRPNQVAPPRESGLLPPEAGQHASAPGTGAGKPPHLPHQDVRSVEPSSPGGASVGDLLDSLCADMGFEETPAEGDAPVKKPAADRAPPPSVANLGLSTTAASTAAVSTAADTSLRAPTVMERPAAVAPEVPPPAPERPKAPEAPPLVEPPTAHDAARPLAEARIAPTQPGPHPFDDSEDEAQPRQQCTQPPAPAPQKENQRELGVTASIPGDTLRTLTLSDTWAEKTAPTQQLSQASGAAGRLSRETSPARQPADALAAKGSLKAAIPPLEKLGGLGTVAAGHAEQGSGIAARALRSQTKESLIEDPLGVDPGVVADGAQSQRSSAVLKQLNRDSQVRPASQGCPRRLQQQQVQPVMSPLPNLPVSGALQMPIMDETLKLNPLTDDGAEGATAGAPSGKSRHKSKDLGPVRPWSPEEAAQLRRIVKRVVKGGTRDKEALWKEVAVEVGNGRSARECKAQYALDYKAHKARSAAANAEET